MAIEELSSEPHKFTAGDSVQWRVTYSDYLPSDGWTLSYKLINQSSAYAITSTTDGDEFVVALNSTDTGSYEKGSYNFLGYVVNGADRITVHSETVDIFPNLASQTTGFDGRSDVKKTLDLLDAALTTMGTKAWTQSYTIGDKSVTFRSFKEFTDFRDRMRREVQAEINKSRIAAGKKPRNKILVRM